jgi:hypothetical protein
MNVANALRANRIPSMRLWVRVIAMFWVLLWGPLTAHCRLEQFPGFQLLLCNPHEESSPHEDSDCQDDGCAVVESGSYRTEEDQPPVATPSVQSAGTCLVSIPDIPSAPELRRVFATAEIPLLATTWQFFLRTALPPRAP